jgi:hypothetical protein
MYRHQTKIFHAIGIFTKYYGNKRSVLLSILPLNSKSQRNTVLFHPQFHIVAMFVLYLDGMTSVHILSFMKICPLVKYLVAKPEGSTPPTPKSATVHDYLLPSTPILIIINNFKAWANWNVPRQLSNQLVMFSTF